MLRAQAIRKIYETPAGPVTALDHADVDVDEGEVVAIIGPSGSGKTTLLNCLSGLDVPTEGQVHLGDTRVDQLDEEGRTKLRRERMAFVFQAYNLIPVLTAVENVELPLSLLGVPVKEARERALESLDLVGLSERATLLPARLSGGEQQRVALARALVKEPDVLFADEPTGALDEATSTLILDLMRRLNGSHGTTMIIVTHDPLVSRTADRVVTVEGGRVVAT